MAHFNNLTPDQAELLAMLAEECGEVIQIIGKILRHGLDNHHPDNPEIKNRNLLAKEILDVEVIIHMIEMSRMVSQQNMPEFINALSKKLRFTHHQDELRSVMSASVQTVL